MEQVRFGDVIDLIGPADPPGHRKAPVRQMIEERQLGQQALDADDLPAGRMLEHAVEIVELRYRVRRHAEALLVLEEFVASATDQELLLALEQRRPGFVIRARVAGPRLIDDRRRVDRHGAFVSLLMLDAVRLGIHGDRRFHSVPRF
jgi:hypothetical protein